MMNEVMLLVFMVGYLAAWGTGMIEGFLFSRYIRMRNPEMAAVRYPGMLKSSVSQQWETWKWERRRGYEEAGDAELTRRVDRHRLMVRWSVGLMVACLAGLLIVGNTIFHDPEEGAAEPPRDAEG